MTRSAAFLSSVLVTGFASIPRFRPLAISGHESRYWFDVNPEEVPLPRVEAPYPVDRWRLTSAEIIFQTCFASVMADFDTAFRHALRRGELKASRT